MKVSQIKIIRFKRIDSTNNAAFRYAKRGVPEGTVFLAEYQTQGRGKWGRHWLSPAGKNLLFSILLRPQFNASKAPLLTQIACRSVAKVLEKEYKLAPAFKRPNDVMVREKKICGVLVEAKGQASGSLESLVIGIGVNVNVKSDELISGATSLYEETGRKQSRERLLRALLIQIRKDLNQSCP